MKKLNSDNLIVTSFQRLRACKRILVNKKFGVTSKIDSLTIY